MSERVAKCVILIVKLECSATTVFFVSEYTKSASRFFIEFLEIHNNKLFLITKLIEYFFMEANCKKQNNGVESRRCSSHVFSLQKNAHVFNKCCARPGRPQRVGGGSCVAAADCGAPKPTKALAPSGHLP